MSVQECKRVAVMGRVAAGEVPVVEAARMLGVSYRQAQRLWARYQRGGAKGLVHGNVGRRSNHARPAAERTHVLALIRTHYGGRAAPGPGQRFGPTLVAEHLWDEHGVLVPVTTLRTWMRAAGLWSRARVHRRRFRRRERRAHFGELVQLDGSFHDWLEGRSPEGPARRCLMTMIDDATGRTFGRLTGEETTWGAASVLRGWIAQYGVPQALYVDAKSLYVPRPTTMEQQRGARVYTQFGRMCRKLGIELIVAKTPQAKGRIERVHGTNQDRLVKKLRRAGVTTYAAAQAYVDAGYWAAHNARFAIRPRSAVDYHVRRARTVADRDLWCLETERVLGNDWVVRHENRGYQVLARGAGRRYCAPGRRVLVRETEDGVVRVLVRSVDGREHDLDWVPAVVVPRGHPRPVPAVAPPTPVPPTVQEPTQEPPVVRYPRGSHPALQASREYLQAKDQGYWALRRARKAYNERRRAEAAARRGALAPPAPLSSPNLNPSLNSNLTPNSQP